MSDQPILYCPQCNHICKSLRGLAQHITHRPLCRPKSLPFLAGVKTKHAPLHQSFVQLDNPHADVAMEPMWHQHADSNAFEPDETHGDTINLSGEEQHHLHEATFRSVYMHQNHLDKQVSNHLSNNCLVDAGTLLDTEDRQDIMLDVDESFTFHDEDCGTIPFSNRDDVDDNDDALQFTDRLRGQHTAEEIMSLLQMHCMFTILRLHQ